MDESDAIEGKQRRRSKRLEERERERKERESRISKKAREKHMLHGRTSFHTSRPFNDTQRCANRFANGSGGYFQGETAKGEQRQRKGRCGV
jgi:hypothetical protein